MISLLKKRTPIEPQTPYRPDEGPTIEVSIDGWEIDEIELQKAFQVFATAVLGYQVKVEITSSGGMKLRAPK